MTIRWRKLFSLDLRKAEVSSLFRSIVISVIQRLPISAYWLWERPKTDQDWTNLPCWVQWRDLFSVSKRSKSIRGRFLKFQILLLFNVKSQYVENLALMLLDRFETENKSRHCTQRNKWLQPSSILGRSRVNRPKLRVVWKILLTFQRNKLDTSALRRSKEKNFLYRIVMSKGKIFVGEVRLKSRSPETIKHPWILMSLVSVYFSHICISNGEKRRLIVVSVLENTAVHRTCILAAIVTRHLSYDKSVPSSDRMTLLYFFFVLSRRYTQHSSQWMK